MNICIFDTETTSLEKPFCYNVGYVIMDTDTQETLVEREFVIEQIWHNLPLFNSAYYADKRPIYVQAMRSRKIKLDKWGYVCRQMSRDFQQFAVHSAYAFNSGFDEKVFAFNCDWFKCINPFDTVPIFDIRGYVHKFLVNDVYKKICDKYEYFTENGHYSTTAETVFRVIFDKHDFIEDHTALSDAKIEAAILFECWEAGAEFGTNYKAKRSIERPQEKTLHIRTVEQTDYYFEYNKIRINKEKTEITLKE